MFISRFQLILSGVLLLVFSPLQAQLDAIYYKNNDKKLGRVTEVTPKVVEFENDGDGKSIKVEKSELELILFSNGSFLTFPSDYKGTEPPAANRHMEDWILTKDQGIVACKIEDGENDPILVALPDSGTPANYKVPKSELIAILFSNGRKQLLGNPASMISGILKNKKMKTAAEFLASYEVKKPKILTDKDKSLDLSDEVMAQFRQRGEHKTRLLEQYLNLIANKSTENSVAQNVTNQAIDLFISDTVIITTEKNGKKRESKIRDYFNKLRLLKYSNVTIKWSKINYLSSFRKAPDGSYWAVISFEQTFSGFMDNKLVYEDKTRKNIEVQLKTYKKFVDGEELELWDAFLGNIGISAGNI